MAWARVGGMFVILAAAGGFALSTKAPANRGGGPGLGGIATPPAWWPTAESPRRCQLVKYYSSTAHFFLLLTERDVILVLETGIVRLHFPSGNPKPLIEVEPTAGGGGGLFFGAPPYTAPSSQGYRRVNYRGVYPGIDVQFHANGDDVEHDFVVAPGGEPGDIRMLFEGADRVHVNEDGALVMEAGNTEFSLSRPLAYQGLPHREGQAGTVSVQYAIGGNGEVGFRLGPYDRTKTLTIDPVWQIGTPRD